MGEGFKVQHQSPILISYLYNLGDECTALTGGWSNTYTQFGGVYTENADNLYLSASGTNFKKQASFANLIDLTNYSYLKIDWGYTASSSGGFVKLCVDTQNTASMESASVRLEHTGSSSTRIIESIDVSSINGLRYVGLYVQTWSSSYQANLSAYKMWLEV